MVGFLGARNHVWLHSSTPYDLVVDLVVKLQRWTVPVLKYTRQIKFSNFFNIGQSLHMINKSHILEYGRKW